MNIVNMPGFTADASLDKTLEYFRPHSSGLFGFGRASVEAQRWIATGRCIPNCICIGPDECPCCISGDPGWPGTTSGGFQRQRSYWFSR
jgi:hypothetical protein